MNLVIYTRASTDRQTASPHTQEELCRAWSVDNGHIVTHVYHERFISGKSETERRIALPELLAAVRDRKHRGFDGILVWRSDRLMRNPGELDRVLNLLDKYHCAIFSVTDPIKRDTAADRFLTGVLAQAASYERELIAERVYAKHLVSHASGRYTGSYVAMGLTWNKEAYRFEVNDRISDAIVVYQTFIDACGNGSETARRLNGEGIPSPMNRLWTHQGVMSIVRGPMYRRCLAFDGRIQPVPDLIPETIPTDMLALVEPFCGLSKRMVPTAIIAHQPYSGLVKCSECGASYVTIKSGHSSWKCQGDIAGVCESRQISHRMFDKLVGIAVGELVRSLGCRSTLRDGSRRRRNGRFPSNAG